MLLLIVEIAFCGPLNHQPTLRALEGAVAASCSLEDVARQVDAIPGLAAYLGGSHVAIHSRFQDGLSFTRWAMITDQPDISG